VEAGIGQKYGFQVNLASISTNAGAPLDLFTLTAQANIPILIERVLLSAPVNQAQSVPINVVVRSAAGSGGSTTLATISAEPPSGSNATEVLAYNVTTVGALVKTEETGSWQLFGQYVFNRKPGGLLITPGQTFAISVPTNGIGQAFTLAVGGEYIALK
jgi:hypothetical protein